MFECLLLRNCKLQTVHECSLNGLLQILGFLFRYEIQNGGYKLQTVHECSLNGLLQILGFLFRYEIQNGATAGLSFFSKHFFSETTLTIETKPAQE